MNSPEDHPVSGGSSSAFDSLTVDLVIVDGNEDTSVRPVPPSLRAGHAAYRQLLADPTRPRPDNPSAAPT